MKTVALSLVIGLVVVVVGCGPNTSNLPATVPAQGVLTLDGQPVDTAAVTFIADSGNYHATAMTDASGKFALKAFPEKEGAVPGSYKVEINKTIVSAGKDAGDAGEGTVNVKLGIPEKYASMATSGLTCTIPEAGDTNIKIEMTSK
jgi:hypothetical protein